MRLLFSIFILYTVLSCEQQAENKYISLEGRTMGTYYKVTYAKARHYVEQEEIDQLLVDINNEVSTYIDTSTISKFNKAEEQLVLEGSSLYSSIDKQISGHFLANFMAAKEIYALSEGYFDPTVMPLVNYWGFGYTERRPVEAIDSVIIDSLLHFVGFEKVSLREVEP